MGYVDLIMDYRYYTRCNDPPLIDWNALDEIEKKIKEYRPWDIGGIYETLQNNKT